jgi:hypothetical protein
MSDALRPFARERKPRQGVVDCCPCRLSRRVPDILRWICKRLVRDFCFEVKPQIFSQQIPSCISRQ